MNALLALIALLAQPFGALANSLPRDFGGFYAEYKDWSIACDNTGTCRAAGYQPDSDGEWAPASILLTREAGPSASVHGEATWQPGNDDEGPKSVELLLNGRPLGLVREKLTSEQVQAILATASTTSRIEFRSGESLWRVSDRGIAAVLLKMDEFQGRLGTTGALIRKGAAPEARVPAAATLPVVRPVKVPIAPASIPAAQWPALVRSLAETLSDCDGLSASPLELAFSPLDADRLMVSTVCHHGAYNVKSGIWVISRAEPFRPVLVTPYASEGENGAITRRHKVRGLGDCWEGTDWVWTGQQFSVTENWTSGMCRGFAGGAWTFYTWRARVVGVGN